MLRAIPLPRSGEQLSFGVRQRKTMNSRSAGMRRIAITLAVLTVVAIRCVNAGDPTNRSVELQVLDRFIGSWESVFTIKATGEKFNTIENRRWSKEGKFVLSEDLNLSSKKEAHFLMTYDPNAKAYRACFIEEGNAVVLLGTWDKDAQVMKWAGPDGAGAKHTGATRFIDKDHVELSMLVVGPDGKVLVELSAKQTRRKA
jgi:hypothetical protein